MFYKSDVEAPTPQSQPLGQFYVGSMEYAKPIPPRTVLRVDLLQNLDEYDFNLSLQKTTALVTQNLQASLSTYPITEIFPFVGELFGSLKGKYYLLVRHHTLRIFKE